MDDFCIEDGILVRYYGEGGNVKIPDGITSIYKNAFRSCSKITDISIPESVTSIGQLAFVGCKGLTDIKFPDRLKVIGEAAFYCCGNLKTVSIPCGAVSIETHAFSRCSALTSLIFFSVNTTSNNRNTESVENGLKCGNSVSSGCAPMISIGTGAFAGCNALTEITIPDCVTSIDGQFSYCGNFTVKCTKNSYAYDYCLNNGYRIEEITV